MVKKIFIHILIFILIPYCSEKKLFYKIDNFDIEHIYYFGLFTTTRRVSPAIVCQFHCDVTLLFTLCCLSKFYVGSSVRIKQSAVICVFFKWSYLKENIFCKFPFYFCLPFKKYFFVAGLQNMKPAVVADEMFPEGAGPYMDLEEVFNKKGNLI